MQPDGLYTLQVVVTDGSANATSTITATLDNTAPTLAITAPVAGHILSNFTGRPYEYTR